MTRPLSPNCFSVGQERERESEIKYSSEKRERKHNRVEVAEKICATINHIISLLIDLKFHCRHELNQNKPMWGTEVLIMRGLK